MRSRHRLATISGVIGAIAATWAAVIRAAGGFDVWWFGVHLTTNDPLRPLALSAIALAVFIWARGAGSVHATVATALGRVRDRWIVVAIVVWVFGIALARGSTAVGGSDSYGYVSQADLWLNGHLRQQQPAIVGTLPWPHAETTLAPLAYHPRTIDGRIVNVPTYPPGLPLLMAGAKAIGGQRAVFLVGPLFGALMVLATWGVGLRLGSSRAGVVGAWLLATSPVFLIASLVPMSDAAGASAWAMALYFLLGDSALSAIVAGCAAGLAILIRPNLVYIAAIMGVWLVARSRTSALPFRQTLLRAGCFSIPVIAAIAGLAMTYEFLNGSPTESGYGALRVWLPENILENARLYGAWFVQTQTWIGVIGLVAALVPLRSLWPHLRDRSALWLAAVIVAAVWLQYCAYMVWDSWLFLRFLLPTWPLIVLSLAAVALWIARRGPALALAACGVVAGLGVYDFQIATRLGVFEAWKDHREFASVAEHVAQTTAPSSVIVSMQHSGSLRYYAGRLTIRYDELEPDWLDRSVEWLAGHNVHVYMVLDDWETANVMRRFAGQQLVRTLTTPIWTYHGIREVSMFDLSGAAPASTPQRFIDTFADPRRVPQPASEQATLGPP